MRCGDGCRKSFRAPCRLKKNIRNLDKWPPKKNFFRKLFAKKIVSCDDKMAKNTNFVKIIAKQLRISLHERGKGANSSKDHGISLKNHR